jgi:hypothetical protein
MQRQPTRVFRALLLGASCAAAAALAATPRASAEGKYYFPPPGESLTQQSRRQPAEVGLDPAIVRSIAQHRRYAEAARGAGSMPMMYMPYAHRDWYGRSGPGPSGGRGGGLVIYGAPDWVAEAVKVYKRRGR